MFAAMNDIDRAYTPTPWQGSNGIKVTKTGPTQPFLVGAVFNFTLTADVTSGAVGSMTLTDQMDPGSGVTFISVSPATGMGAAQMHEPGLARYHGTSEAPAPLLPSLHTGSQVAQQVQLVEDGTTVPSYPLQ